MCSWLYSYHIIEIVITFSCLFVSRVVYICWTSSRQKSLNGFFSMLLLKSYSYRGHILQVNIRMPKRNLRVRCPAAVPLSFYAKFFKYQRLQCFPFLHVQVGLNTFIWGLFGASFALELNGLCLSTMSTLILLSLFLYFYSVRDPSC